jgi:NNP family nitrate/nitrite transporter-like MFS transporter
MTPEPHPAPQSATLSPNDNYDLSSQLIPILFLTGIFLLNFLSRSIIAPLLPQMELDLGLSHAQAGSFFFFITTGYFIGLTGSGFLAARLRHRRTIIISVATMGLALVAVGLSPSRLIICGALSCMGMAAGLYLPSGIATITTIARPVHWGRALAIHELAPNLAVLAAPLVVVWLMPILSWRGIVMAIGCASFGFGLCYIRWGRGGEFPGRPPDAKSLARLMKLPAFWIMSVLINLGVMGTMGVFTMLPLYLVNEHKLSMDSANLLIAVSRISSPFMALSSGWISDRLGIKPTMALVLAIGGATTMGLGLVSGFWIKVIVIAQPIASVCLFPPAFAAVALIVSPEERSLAVSLTAAIGIVVGGGLFPWLVGHLGEIGAFSSGYILAGGVIMAGTALLPWLRFGSAEEELRK